MWLLSTARAELHFFSDPSLVPGGFAILSHTWSPKGELSFQQLQEICSNCQQTRENPRDRVHEKIRKCCEVAERNGYSWVWIDTCCINKESSTELSEAINSCSPGTSSPRCAMHIWRTCTKTTIHTQATPSSGDHGGTQEDGRSKNFSVRHSSYSCH